MASARTIRGLEPDMEFRAAAAKVVTVRSDELFERVGHLGEGADAEAIHAARVATRRLRAVLEIFAPCFRRKPHAAVLAEVKRFARALGARRDPDVQMIALEGLRDAAAVAERPVLDGLLSELRQDQADGDRVISQALERLRAGRLSEKLARLGEDAKR